MNCKPGDLAIVVRSVCGNEGKIVRCVRFVGAMEDRAAKDMWQTDVPLKTVLGRSKKAVKPEPYVSDSSLRPIRDPGDDAVDETLLRLPSPRQEVTA